MTLYRDPPPLPDLRMGGMMDVPTEPQPTRIQRNPVDEPIGASMQEDQPISLPYGPNPGMPAGLSPDMMLQRYQQSLFDASRQAMQQSFAGMLQSANRQPSPRERGMDVGQNVFRNLAAPMIGIFGPRGFEKGTANWISEEKKRQDDLHGMSRQQRNESINSLKGLADVMERADQSRMDEFAQMTNYYKMLQMLPYQQAAQEAEIRRRNAAASSQGALGGQRDARTKQIEKKTEMIAPESQAKVAKEDAHTSVYKEQAKTQKQRGSLVQAQTKTAEAKTNTEKARAGATGALQAQREARTAQIGKTPVKGTNGGGADKPVKNKDLPSMQRMKNEQDFNLISRKYGQAAAIKWFRTRRNVTF